MVESVWDLGNVMVEETEGWQVKVGKMERKNGKWKRRRQTQNNTFYEVLVTEAMEEENTEVGNVSECGMTFHVTDSKRVLASVARMTEAGNEVKFGPEASDCYVRNRKTGTKLYMRKEKNLYVLDVWFIHEDGKKVAGQIVVDSGAAEHVMPKDVLMGERMIEKKSGVKFVAANGKEMEYYGRKQINFIPRNLGSMTGFGGRR